MACRVSRLRSIAATFTEGEKGRAGSPLPAAARTECAPYHPSRLTHWRNAFDGNGEGRAGSPLPAAARTECAHKPCFLSRRSAVFEARAVWPWIAKVLAFFR
jgi:hypothetical protein